MKRRSGKYLNAREYAERLRLSDNKDVQDFAEEFLDALDFQDGQSQTEIEKTLDKFTDGVDAEVGTSIVERIEWLGTGSDTLLAIEKSIGEDCPEYDIEKEDTETIITDLIRRARSKQVFDL
jgi:hypothetical protein